MNASLCLPKWIVELHCYSVDFGIKNRMIQAIYVDSPTLSSSYFKEYLGFKIVFRSGRGRKLSILLYKQGNLIFVKSNGAANCKSISNSEVQSIKVASKNIEADYLALREKVRFAKHLSKVNNRIRTFVITDCNGIDIVYLSKA